MSNLQDSVLFTPYRLGQVTLRNRTIRSAAFESMGKDFSPTQQLKDYHVSVARGGIGMTTLAYAAVCRSGLSFKSQLWLRPEIVPALRDITDAIHKEGAAASIQIGHCGNMTHYSTAGQIPIGASSGFNLYAYTPVRKMRRDEIMQVSKDFGKAVRTAHAAGFDCVEVHAGHGYLISQFLSPYTNHRRDEYGGSLDNRMRFMRMCLEEVMNAADATGTSVLVKHNMYDGFKGGIEILKVDADTKQPLAGVVFRLFDANGNKIADGTTDATGKVTFSGLRLGKYVYQEISTVDGYVLDETKYDFSLTTANLNIKVTRENAPAKGSITVRKVEVTDSPLAGAELLLETSADGKTWTEVGRVTTDNTGIAKWENLKTGVQYRVTETKAPAGYTLLTEPLFAGVLDSSNRDVTITACNNAGFALPFTGGTGFTTYFLFAALALMAGVYFCKKSNIKKENTK